ncbi:elongation factor P hydroxylase [Niveispirillum sp. KHB5.9]|uniref:elongation factor P hydroxylase n=1 Tax=Niveispirillum sp. KHB5.9 TaxID=3400269 RepID=UPI003A85D6EB
MQLTTIPDDILPQALDSVAANLSPGSLTAKVLARIAATRDLIALGVDTAEHRAAAVDLARAFGIGVIDEAPQDAFSYDGVSIRTRSEAYVLIHEVAHWLVAPPERRGLVDFGLGAGPESGRIDEANEAIAVGKDEQIREEALASLLGILWEVELGQPAVLAFLEQNWLEGWDRASCAQNLADNVDQLFQAGLIDAEGRPFAPESCVPGARAAA